MGRSVWFVWSWMILGVFEACGFPTLERAASPDAETGDGSIPISTSPGDALPGDALPPVCYGTGIVKNLCFATAPTGTFLVTGAAQTINTDTSTMCAPPVSGGAGYCVIAAADISIASTLKATGTKSLVLLAVNTIVTSGSSEIDVGSHRIQIDEVIGAGADPSDCQAGTPPQNGGGGAGGSFTSKGGNGGKGVGPGNAGTPGANVASPTTLRGGCPGQDGQGAQGKGGHGGGAVFLIAGTSIQIDGEIAAGGEGGKGGDPAAAADQNGNGGGGAGAGGMIGFDAPTVTATNAIVANGGGAGEGGSGKSGNAAGNNGKDAEGFFQAAGGNQDNFSGGFGGNGSILSTVAGGDGEAGTMAGGGSIGGGGGGGGGAGFIIAPPGAALGTQVSPPVTTQQ